IVAHSPEIEALEQPQLLEKYRALRPRLTLMHGDAMIVDADGSFEFGCKSRQIVFLEQTTVGFRPPHDFLCDVSPIEAIAGRLDGCFAAAIARTRLSVE